MMRLIVSLLLAFPLVACTIGPDYQRPSLDLPADWRLPASPSEETADLEWWRQLDDPVLDELIVTALQENNDLKIAAARVEEFAGRYGVTRAELFPQIGYGGDAGRERLSESGSTPLPAGIENPSDSYSALLDASWEIDLWGRIRRASEAARAELIASEEGRRGIVLSLASAVASGYVDLRSLDRQLEIARRTAESRGESLRIFNLRFEAGIISELELSQVRSEYEQALATIPQIERLIFQTEHALSELLGRNPEAIPRGREIELLALPDIPAGLPADLLVRRPDIRQAEQELIAANARIGVARAAYFPSISLTGFFGSSSGDLDDLFSGPAETWQYSGRLLGPIFTAGRIAGQVRAAEAVQQQALHNYRKVIQAAFREFADGLADQDRTREQRAAQKRQVAALQSYAEMALLRYDNGYTSYIEVLDAERSLFNAELEYTQSTANQFRALINLYKAMGGGWVDQSYTAAQTAD